MRSHDASRERGPTSADHDHDHDHAADDRDTEPERPSRRPDGPRQVSGKIVNVRHVVGGTHVVLNRGAAAGVQAGWVARLGHHAMVIEGVDDRECWGVVDASMDTITGGPREAVIAPGGAAAVARPRRTRPGEMIGAVRRVVLRDDKIRLMVFLGAEDGVAADPRAVDAWLVDRRGLRSRVELEEVEDFSSVVSIEHDVASLSQAERDRLVDDWTSHGQVILANRQRDDG